VQQIPQFSAHAVWNHQENEQQATSGALAGSIIAINKHLCQLLDQRSHAAAAAAAAAVRRSADNGSLALTLRGATGEHQVE